MYSRSTIARFINELNSIIGERIILNCCLHFIFAFGSVNNNLILLLALTKIYFSEPFSSTQMDIIAKYIYLDFFLITNIHLFYLMWKIVLYKVAKYYLNKNILHNDDSYLSKLLVDG